MPSLSGLASDPVLHRNRVRIIAPSRVQHSLFGTSLHGIILRPTVGDLVQRGVMRGLGIERRWRTGAYFYSRSSVTQYENGLRFARQRARDVVSIQLKCRSSPKKFLNSLHVSYVLPDVESSSLGISRTLLPAMHRLKWSIQRDRLSRAVRIILSRIEGPNGTISFGGWFEGRAYGVIQDGERVRLAICPDIRKTIEIFERLGYVNSPDNV